MASLRQGIQNAQFQTQPSTKLLAVAAKFGLKPPISLLRVASLLKPETVDWHFGPVISGDDELVTASGHLSMTSIGFWKFTGEVKDEGDGATFAVTMKPNFVDPSGKSLLFGEGDELSDDEKVSFKKEGRDLWIARNWDGIRDNGSTWKLEASTTMGVGEIFVKIILPIVAVGAAIFSAAECEKWVSQTDENGNVHAVCEFK